MYEIMMSEVYAKGFFLFFRFRIHTSTVYNTELKQNEKKKLWSKWIHRFFFQTHSHTPNCIVFSCFFFSIYFLWSPLFSYSKCKESNFRRIIFTFLSYCILLFYRAITWNAFKCNLFLSFDEHWTLFCTHSFRNWWYTYAYVYV